jgi:predicted MFS family arabinose efflux permease
MTTKAFEGVTDTVANIHQWSLRQVVTPDHLAGRVTAGHRFAVYGAGAAGALVGGALGTALGLRPALFVCALGALLSPLLAVLSPLRQLREQPVSDSLSS